MDFSTTAGALRDALASARHATPTTPSLIAYSGVLFSVKGRQLSVVGSDGETLTIAANVALESGSDGQALLLPRPLGNFLSTLASDEVITGTLTPSGELEVKPSSSNAYRFRPVAATFPLPPTTRTAPREVDLSRLGPALSAVRASIVRDNPGVQLVSSSTGLVLHSTDNYRLSRAVLPEAGFGDFTGVVPLGVVERLSRSNVNQVNVDAKGRTLRFSGPELSITARLLSTVFPSVEGVLDATPPSSVEVPVAALRQSLARLGAIAESAPLRVRLENSTMTLTVSNADLGSGSETVELLSDATAPFEFLVKLSYLSDTCVSHDGASFTLGYSSAIEPLFVRSKDPLAVTTVVMPVRG